MIFLLPKISNSCATLDEFCFEHTNVADLVGPASISQAGAFVPTIANLALYMAIESNEGVRNSIMAKVTQGGLQMTIPYPTVYLQALGTNLSQSVNYKINRGHGQRLLRILSAENSLITADHWTNRCLFNNFGGDLTQVFNTQLDSKRMQVEDLNVLTADDHKYNKRWLRKTILANVEEYYSSMPVHIDDFSACEDLTEAPEKDLQVCGIDLSLERLWTKYILNKTNTASQTVAVIVCQKTITSDTNGVNIF